MTTTASDNARRDILQTYSDAWSEAEPARRLSLLGQVVQPDFVYTDPLAQVSGPDGISGYITATHQQIPGLRFVVTDFLTHHDRLLIHWDMLNGDGKILIKGASYGMYGANGKLAQMTGFWAT